MTNAIYLLAWSQLTALLAAVTLWPLCRTRMLQKRPALCHALWLLVLVKLVTPSLVSLPVLPASASPELPVAAMSPASAPEGADRVAVPRHIPNNTADRASDEGSPPRDAAIADARAAIAAANPVHAWPVWTLRELSLGLLTLSLLGTAILWLMALGQHRRVARLLGRGAAPSGREVELLRSVSLRFKLRSAVDLRMVNAPITPLLWARPGGAAILLPRKLVDSLDDEQVRNILAHELAHFVRRDHWFNAFALTVTTLFWWNPAAWVARRRLSAAAEACCDALALERAGGSRKSYAQTLLAVVDFVGSARQVRPALCVSFGESHSLRKRFEVLADSSVTSSLSRAGWLLLSLGVMASVLMPARAQEEPPKSAPSPAATPAVPAAATAQNETEQEPKCYVTGIVYDKESKQPIADAKVNVFLPSEQDPAKRGRIGVTDAEGRYRVEVPLGAFRIWFPRLRPGYWLDHADNTVNLVTTLAEPIVTHDISANRGTAWPVRVAVEGGIPEQSELTASTLEIEDDAIRRSWLLGRGNFS